MNIVTTDELKCSFCGRKSKEVKLMFQSKKEPDKRICSVCCVSFKIGLKMF